MINYDNHKLVVYMTLMSANESLRAPKQKN